MAKCQTGKQVDLPVPIQHAKCVSKPAKSGFVRPRAVWFVA